MKLRDWIKELIDEDDVTILMNENAVFLNKNNYNIHNYSTKCCYSENKNITMILTYKQIKEYLIPDHNNMSSNPNAINFLRNNIKLIDWKDLSLNENINQILDIYKKKDIYYFIIENLLDWNNLSDNLGAIELLKKYPNKINWVRLSRNPASGAIELLEQNIEKVDWNELCLNENPAAIKLLEKYKNVNEINWFCLSYNPAAIKLLEQNIDRIDWMGLSKNPAAIYLIEKYPDRIDFLSLCKNQNAIELLEKYKYMIKNYWYNISSNPAIFEYDYNKMDEYFGKLNKEIYEYYWHPSRIDKFKWQISDLE
jgi:hypothetical protein